VAFDLHKMGLPVAWSIQKKKRTEMIGKFLQAVKDRCNAIKPNWMPKCFIIDCGDAKIAALKVVFPDITIYFCS
jgi:hypothetical protein